MKEIIGFWLIALAVTILFTWAEPIFTIKEKILCIVGIMTVVSLLFAGVCLMVGGV